MWQCNLDHKWGWTLRNWYFWNTVLEKTLVSPLGCKEINPVNSKGNQSWKFTGGADVRPKLQYYGYLMWRANSLAKNLMLQKIGAEEGDDGGPDTWMASPTQWIWVWTSSGRWRRTRWCDILQSMGLWRVGDDWVTEQQITASNNKSTECIWPWVVSGALEACHRSETQDSGKILNVFDLELVKQ